MWNHHEKFHADDVHLHGSVTAGSLFPAPILYTDIESRVSIGHHVPQNSINHDNVEDSPGNQIHFLMASQCHSVTGNTVTSSDIHVDSGTRNY